MLAALALMTYGRGFFGIIHHSFAQLCMTYSTFQPSPLFFEIFLHICNPESHTRTFVHFLFISALVATRCVFPVITTYLLPYDA